jgi:heat shock protein HtpX
MPVLDRAALARHRRRNAMQSALVLAAIGAWMALVGWLVAGDEGIVWAALGAAVMMIAQPAGSAAMLRAVFGAVPLSRADAPGLCRMVEVLAGRAGLDRVPPLLYIPRRDLAALSTGWGADAAIAVSDGLLHALDNRRLAAVLAHEISHIQHGDLIILRVAEAAGRLTRLLSMFALLVVVFYLPAAAAAGAEPPLLPLLLLVAAPIACDLLTLKLSRTREFAADAGAAALTGDPEGLMAALETIDAIQGNGWERLLKVPAWLALIRTHPTNSERLERLAELAPPRYGHDWPLIDLGALRALLPPRRFWGAW